jgi:hypothetical protein
MFDWPYDHNTDPYSKPVYYSGKAILRLVYYDS